MEAVKKLKRIRIVLIVLTSLTASKAMGQYSYEPVFPGLSGAALISELKSSFRPQVVLDYSIARDTLFSKIDGRRDSLACIYTGLTLPMPPGKDPTEAVYMGGIPNGINTEHAWPQGKGAVAQAQSDMHHLFPSRIKTNADRADHPFANIPDVETKIWYLRETERTTPPATGRDAYSEYVPGRFEPREAVKGNIARAMFYFYTMYKELADAADASYFDKMKATLCDWHYADPVDQAEWLRNQKIATYQGGRSNPFVLDCSLVSRAYCDNLDQACEAIISSGTDDRNIPFIGLFPNPGHSAPRVFAPGFSSQPLTVSLFDLAGRQIAAIAVVWVDASGYAFPEWNPLPPGCWLVRVASLDMTVSKTLLYYSR